MLKSIQYLLLLSASILVWSYPALAKDDHPDQTQKLYQGFFPYQTCLQVSINQVSKNSENVLILKAKIEESLRGNFKKGQILSLGIRDQGKAPESLAFLSKLRGTKQIIAFSSASRNSEPAMKKSYNPICNLWVPYSGGPYQPKDIELLKSIIKSSPIEPKQAKAEFQKMLESRWNTDRINDFCRPETQRNWLSPLDQAGSNKTDWFGTLHSSKGKELSEKKINWTAHVSNNVPIVYSINIDDSNKDSAGWDLGLFTPSLEIWNQDDFIIFRLRKSISQAAFADWSLHHETSKYWDLFSPSDEALVKDKKGNVISYQCKLGNGKTFTAILTKQEPQSIGTILINGTADPGWNDMYHKSLENLRQCKEKVQQ